MESIHKASTRSWIDEKAIPVGEFIAKWKDKLAMDIIGDTGYKPFDLPFSEEEMLEVEKECGLDAIRCTFQERVEKSHKFTVPEGVTLKTVELQKKDLDKRATSQRYRNAKKNAMRFTNYPPHELPNVDLEKLDPAPINMPEAVLTVQIYSPQRKADRNAVKPMKAPSFHVHQEFLVLGCQYLTQLRDVIDCISDKAIPGDYSEDPSALPTTTCKDIYKSGFFYIDGVFYNDMRYEDCKDYSETIINWSKGRGIGPFKKAHMEEYRFVDISVQLGYPYVYIHQGDCEHLMVFTDLRLFSPRCDVNNRNAYPRYVKIRQGKRLLCFICHEFTALWVVRDNKLLPETPFFMCKACFLKFHYDKDNKKIGEFKAYYYPNRYEFH